MNQPVQHRLIRLLLSVVATATLQAQTPSLIVTNPAPTINEDFGAQIAVLGELILIAAPGDAGYTGVVHGYDRQGTPVRTFSNPTPDQGNFFGTAVTAVGTGKVLISAPWSSPPPAGQSGAAHLFHTNGTLIRTFLHPRQQRSAGFGGAVAALGDDRVLITATLDNLTGENDGAVYLYHTDGTLLATIPNPDPGTGGNFGSPVAVLGPDRFLVGAPGDSFRSVAGVAHLFSADGLLLRTFRDPNGLMDSSFGATLVPLGNGRILIGAPTANVEAPGAGAANIFDTEGRILAPIFNPDPGPNDGFGSPAAAVGDDLVLIGSTRKSPDLFGFHTEAHLFNTNGVLLASVQLPLVSISFNNSLARLDSDRVLIGVPGANPTDDPSLANSGLAYVFPLAPALKASWTESGALRLSWPSPWDGWLLQQQTTLAPTGWESVPGLPDDDGFTRSVSVPSVAAQGYFRLVKP